MIGERLAGRRLPLLLMTAFGAFALLLASVGVYAMFANLIAARERELAVRLALGPGPRAIAGLVFCQGAGWMASASRAAPSASCWWSVCCGICSTGVPAFDPVALGVTVSMLVAYATIAMLVPLRRRSGSGRDAAGAAGGVRY